MSTTGLHFNALLLARGRSAVPSRPLSPANGELNKAYTAHDRQYRESQVHDEPRGRRVSLRPE